MTATNTAPASFGTSNWNRMSFRERFGDSLFQTDGQKRLEDYTEADMARVQTRSRLQFKAESFRQSDASAQNRDRLGLQRAATPRSVEQSFGATTGAQFKAMALRA